MRAPHSNHLLSLYNWYAATFLTLLIGEVALQRSSAVAAASAALSALLTAPLFAPRWSLSIIEAGTVPAAVLGVLVLWVVVPIAGAAKVAGIGANVARGCGFAAAR